MTNKNTGSASYNVIRTDFLILQFLKADYKAHVLAHALPQKHPT